MIKLTKKKLFADYEIEVTYLVRKDNKWYNETNKFLGNSKYKLITKKIKARHNYTKDKKVALGIAKMIAKAYKEAIFPYDINTISVYAIRVWVDGKYIGEA